MKIVKALSKFDFDFYKRLAVSNVFLSISDAQSIGLSIRFEEYCSITYSIRSLPLHLFTKHKEAATK